MRTSLSNISRRKQIMAMLQMNFDAEDFIRHNVHPDNMRREGDELVMSCPLPWGLHAHGDVKASSSFNSRLLKFNCFLCGGGDVFWFVQNVLELDEDELLDLLEREVTPKSLGKEEFMEKLRALFEDDEDESWDLPTYSERLLQPWTRSCKYLTDRGISVETQQEWRTGPDVNHRDKIDDGSESGRWVLQPRLVIPHFYE